MAQNRKVRLKSIRDVKALQRDDMRNAILSTARAIVRERGIEALTMRGLAQQLECSPMTLYSFFEDKHAILVVLALEIFDDLSRDVGGEQSGDPLENLRIGCRKYIRFGLERPNEYRVIFMTPGAIGGSSTISEANLVEKNRAFAIKVERIVACIEAGIFHGDAFAAATMLWTTLHGAVSVIIARPTFPFGDVTIFTERMIDFALGAMVVQHTFLPLPKSEAPI